MKAEPARAWQPLTFGGVARYALDWIGRLVATCLIVSLIVAASVVWTARRAWAPVIDESIARLPPGAEIRGGRLQAPGPLRLGENAFLSIQIDPAGDLRAASGADLQIVLTQFEARFRSLFGVAALPYPRHWTILLSRSEMEPKWGAWRPAALGYLGVGTILFLFASWALVGALFAIVPLLVARMAGRELGVWGSWKLSVASLMPGAVFMAVAIIFYGMGKLRLAEMIVAYVAHFVIGWIFLFGAPLFLPRDPESNPMPDKNPFRDEHGSPDDHSESSDSASESERD